MSKDAKLVIAGWRVSATGKMFLASTPVVAFRSGSVPEVIDEGITGFVVMTKSRLFKP